MAKYGYLIKKVRYGIASTDGTMPTTLTDLPDTVEGSVTIDEKEPTTKDFKVDQSDNPIKRVVTDAGGLEVGVSFYDISPSVLQKLKGGTATAETAWKPAVGSTLLLEMAIQLETTSGMFIDIPKAAVSALITGGLKKDDLLVLKCTMKPLLVASDKEVYGIRYTA